jgi:hypothetical protein
VWSALAFSKRGQIENRDFLAPIFFIFKFIFDANEKKSLPILGSNFKPTKFLSKSSLGNFVAERFFSLAKFRHFSTKKLGNYFFQSVNSTNFAISGSNFAIFLIPNSFFKMSRHNPPHPNYPCVWLIGPLPKKKFV